MKPLALLVLLLLLFSCSNRFPLHSAWDKKVYRKANTARFAFYLSRRSKESIRIVNLMRMNPGLFARTYYLDYLIVTGVLKSKEDTSKPYNGACRSLFRELTRLAPLPRLRPSFALHLSASFHAICSGISGYEGHDYPVPFPVRALMFGTFNRSVGENCDYGTSDPMTAIMDLAIDEGVPGNGHRKNLLYKDFIRVGCSFKFHKKWDRNYVQDFSTGNLFERMKRRRNEKKAIQSFYRKTLPKH